MIFDAGSVTRGGPLARARRSRCHVAVRAAMAHLHVVSVHPFGDGNGRISGIVQSLVLARVQGGAYQPQRDAGPWVELCVLAHVDQARRRLDQLAEAGARWAALEELVERRGWPDRLAIVLEQGLFGGVDRAGYSSEAEVAAPTASIDLRRLVDAGLVVQQGRGPSTRYSASDD